MKTKLAILDFDETIKEYYQGDWDLWTKYNQSLKTGKNLFNSKTEMVEELKQNFILVKGMDQVLKKLSEDHEIIIVSANNLDNVQMALEKYHLDEYIEKIFARPSMITEDAKVLEYPVPNEWGGPCEISGRAICKSACVQYFLKNRKYYEKIVYIGDGKNDLCACLHIDGDNLMIYPRDGISLKNNKKYSLISLLNSRCMQAKITPWNNGMDLLEIIFAQ